jgi:hypothetical protein
MLFGCWALVLRTCADSLSHCCLNTLTANVATRQHRESWHHRPRCNSVNELRNFASYNSLLSPCPAHSSFSESWLILCGTAASDKPFASNALTGCRARFQHGTVGADRLVCRHMIGQRGYPSISLPHGPPQTRSLLHPWRAVDVSRTLTESVLRATGNVARRCIPVAEKAQVTVLLPRDFYPLQGNPVFCELGGAYSSSQGLDQSDSNETLATRVSFMCIV